MRYLCRNPNLPLTLQAGDMNFVHWHVDASFGVHPDMKSHTGMTYSMGKGSVINGSKKQKMNTRSTTESELVGVDDAMPRMIWTHLFTQAQGFTPKVVLHQDNRSAMLLEMHGKASSSQRTRHFNIRYFYIKDQIEQGWIKVKFCPTGEMIMDHFTKPLQGLLFQRFRASIMNCPIDLPNEFNLPAVANKVSFAPRAQECVGPCMKPTMVPTKEPSNKPTRRPMAQLPRRYGTWKTDGLARK